MDDFLFYTKLGLNHILDPNAHDHLLFLVVLTLPYLYKQLRQLVVLVTVFTIGHTVSLWAASAGVIRISASWIEFLIPVTIALSCIPLLSSKEINRNNLYTSMITLVFGLIHGFGFGRYFSLIVTEEDALLDLFSFALGVEAAQIAIVIGVLLVRLFVLNVIKIEKAKWNLIVGSMILSQAILMMFQKAPFQ